MSAFIVDNNHINVIVSWFINPVSSQQAWIKVGDDYNHLTRENAAQVAQILMIQNVRSVDSRYKEENGYNYEFKYITNAKAYSIGEIAMALDGLEYQSCETDDYYQTNAYEIIGMLRKCLLNTLYTKEGADTWAIHEVKQRKVYLTD